MSELLTERTPRVAAARKLLRRAAREETGRFLVEGLRPVHDAVAWAEEGPGPDGHRRLHDLFATPTVAEREPALLARAAATGVRVHLATDRAVASLADTVTPQGIVVVASAVTTPLAHALASARLVAVLLDVADPGNAGTVVRAADAAGADAVVLAGNAVDPHNPKCVRASMGSVFHVPITRSRDVGAVLDAATAAGLTLVAADGHGELELGPATDDLLTRPVAWLFGSEAHGVPAGVAARAEHRVRVPIHGRAESLNLATAAAVCLYASARGLHAPG